MDENHIVLDDLLSQGYGIIPKKVMRDQKLSAEAKAIYAYLCSFCGSGNTAFPSISLMCHDLNLGEDRFLKHRKQLIEYGYIQIKKNKSKKGFSNNVYILPSSVYPDFTGTQNKGTENRGTNNNNLTNNNNKDKRPKQVYDESSQYFKAAVYLKNLADQNFEFLKEPNLQIWADDIRKLAEIDKQPLSLIKEVIEWCQQDEFWFKNIRSASKLRKQFETLTLQMAAKKPKIKPKANQAQNINVNELSKLFGDPE